MYFNPHTREGCDRTSTLIVDSNLISIHTPVKGVTIRHGGGIYSHYDFNPHTREGCDLVSVGGACTPEISIHTPVKGVT